MKGEKEKFALLLIAVSFLEHDLFVSWLLMLDDVSKTKQLEMNPNLNPF